MKKAFSEFIEAKDIEAIFVPNWKDILSDENLNKEMKSLSEVICNNNISYEDTERFITDIAKKLTIPESLNFIVSFYLKGLFSTDREPKTPVLFYSIVDSSDIYRGEIMVCDELKEKLLADQAMDVWIEDNWKTPFSVEHKQFPIYPAAGFVFYENNPLAQELQKRFGVEPQKPMFWLDLSEIYSNYFPGLDKNNTQEYYENLRKLDLYPSISPLSFFFAKKMGALKPNVDFKMFHKYVNTSSIKF